MLKTVVLLHIFGEKFFFLGFFSEWNAHKSLCENFFLNIINVFNVNFKTIVYILAE